MAFSKNSIPRAYSPICAGEGVDLIEDGEPIDLNVMITRGAEHFQMYRIEGDSMCPDILPGDEVVVDPYAYPKLGDRVVVSIGGLHSVKFFQPVAQGGLRLVSANKNYEPRTVTERDEFAVLGVVKARVTLYY